MNTTLHDGIILASESPRRKDLLQRMGLEFTVIPSGLVEMPPMGDSPCAYVSRMAMEKAVHVGQSY
ncbi:MAG: Maf family protein, partial [Candidatus Omnitrophica bacterium]|nr:Maf family protein [Candidatus Omnitrophota bacterium]